MGVDIAAQQPRQLTPELQQAADVVVTVGEAAIDSLPGPYYETRDTTSLRFAASRLRNPSGWSASISSARSTACTTASLRPPETPEEGNDSAYGSVRP